MPRRENVVAACGVPFDISPYYQVTVTYHQRRPDREYYLGYREGHCTVFKQNVEAFDLRKFSNHINRQSR